jgi:hypothetical protein
MTGSARRPAIHIIAALANCLACDELRPVWPIETVIYPGAYHAWTVPDLATARFYPDYVSTKNVRSSCSGRSGRLCSSTARRSPSTRPPSVRASLQRPAIRWDLMRLFAPNRSPRRCGFFNESSDRRIDGSMSFFRVRANEGTDMFYLTPPRHISTLPFSHLGGRSCEVCFALMSRHREFDGLRSKRRSTARASRPAQWP